MENPETITVAHLTRSMRQIESWCGSIREILARMDQDQVVGPNGGLLAKDDSPPKVRGGACPPSEEEKDGEDRPQRVRGGACPPEEDEITQKIRAGTCPSPDELLKIRSGKCPPPEGEDPMAKIRSGRCPPAEELMKIRSGRCPVPDQPFGKLRGGMCEPPDKGDPS